MLIDPRFEIGEDYDASSTRHHQVNEPHSISSGGGRVITPNMGAYYTDSLIVIDAGTGEALKKGEDYECRFVDPKACELSGKEVCGIVTITNEKVLNVILEYRFVGGLHALNYYVLENLIQMYPNGVSSILHWDNILDKDDTFDPAYHTHNVHDLTEGMEVAVAFERIRTALVGRFKDKLLAAYEDADARFKEMYDKIDKMYDERKKEIEIFRKQLQIQEGEYIFMGGATNPKDSRGYGNWHPVVGILEGNSGTAANKTGGLLSSGSEHIVMNSYVWQNLKEGAVPFKNKLSTAKKVYKEAEVITFNYSSTELLSETLPYSISRKMKDGTVELLKNDSVKVVKGAGSFTFTPTRDVITDDVVDIIANVPRKGVSATVRVTQSTNAAYIDISFHHNGAPADNVPEGQPFSLVLETSNIAEGAKLHLAYGGSLKLSDIVGKAPNEVTVVNGRATVWFEVRADGIDNGGLRDLTVVANLVKAKLASRQAKLWIRDTSKKAEAKVYAFQNNLLVTDVLEDTTFEVRIATNLPKGTVLKVAHESDRNDGTTGPIPTSVTLDANGEAKFEVTTMEDNLSNRFRYTLIKFKILDSKDVEIGNTTVKVIDVHDTPNYEILFASDELGTRQLSELVEGIDFYVIIRVSGWEGLVKPDLTVGWWLDGSPSNANINPRITGTRPTTINFSQEGADKIANASWPAVGVFAIKLSTVADKKITKDVLFRVRTKPTIQKDWYADEAINLLDTSIPEVKIQWSSSKTKLTPIDFIPETTPDGQADSAYLWVTADAVSSVYGKLRIDRSGTFPNELIALDLPKEINVPAEGKPAILPFRVLPNFDTDPERWINVSVHAAAFADRRIDAVDWEVTDTAGKMTMSVSDKKFLSTTGTASIVSQYSPNLEMHLTMEALNFTTEIHWEHNHSNSSVPVPVSKLFKQTSGIIVVPPNTTTVVLNTPPIRLGGENHTDWYIIITTFERKHSIFGSEGLLSSAETRTSLGNDSRQASAKIEPQDNIVGETKYWKDIIVGISHLMGLSAVVMIMADAETKEEGGNLYLGYNDPRIKGVNSEILHIGGMEDRYRGDAQKLSANITLIPDRTTNTIPRFIRVNLFITRDPEIVKLGVGAKFPYKGNPPSGMVLDSITLRDIKVEDNSKTPEYSHEVKELVYEGASQTPITVRNKNVTIGDVLYLEPTENSTIDMSRFNYLQMHEIQMTTQGVAVWYVHVKANQYWDPEPNYCELRCINKTTGEIVVPKISFRVADNSRPRVVGVVGPAISKTNIWNSGLSIEDMSSSGEIKFSIFEGVHEGKTTFKKTDFHNLGFNDQWQEKDLNNFNLLLGGFEQVSDSEKIIVVDVVGRYPAEPDKIIPMGRWVVPWQDTSHPIQKSEIYVTNTTYGLASDKPPITSHIVTEPVGEGYTRWVTFILRGGSVHPETKFKLVRKAGRSVDKMLSPKTFQGIGHTRVSDTQAAAYLNKNSYLWVSIPFEAIQDYTTNDPEDLYIDFDVMVDSPVSGEYVFGSAPRVYFADTSRSPFRYDLRFLDKDGNEVVEAREGELFKIQAKIIEWNTSWDKWSISSHTRRPNSDWLVYPSPVTVSKNDDYWKTGDWFDLTTVHPSRNGKKDDGDTLYFSYTFSGATNVNDPRLRNIPIVDASQGVRKGSFTQKAKPTVAGTNLVLDYDIEDLDPLTPLTFKITSKEFIDVGMFAKDTYTVSLNKEPPWGVLKSSITIPSIDVGYVPENATNGEYDVRIEMSHGNYFRTEGVVRFRAKLGLDASFASGVWYLEVIKENRVVGYERLKQQDYLLRGCRYMVEFSSNMLLAQQAILNWETKPDNHLDLEFKDMSVSLLESTTGISAAGGGVAFVHYDNARDLKDGTVYDSILRDGSITYIGMVVEDSFVVENTFKAPKGKFVSLCFKINDNNVTPRSFSEMRIYAEFSTGGGNMKNSAGSSDGSYAIGYDVSGMDLNHDTLKGGTIVFSNIWVSDSHSKDPTLTLIKVFNQEGKLILEVITPE